MQLIYNSETQIDINTKMSTLDEESLAEKLIYDDTSEINHGVIDNVINKHNCKVIDSENGEPITQMEVDNAQNIDIEKLKASKDEISRLIETVREDNEQYKIASNEEESDSNKNVLQENIHLSEKIKENGQYHNNVTAHNNDTSEALEISETKNSDTPNNENLTQSLDNTEDASISINTENNAIRKEEIGLDVVLTDESPHVTVKENKIIEHTPDQNHVDVLETNKEIEKNIVSSDITDSTTKDNSESAIEVVKHKLDADFLETDPIETILDNLFTSGSSKESNVNDVGPNDHIEQTVSLSSKAENMETDDHIEQTVSLPNKTENMEMDDHENLPQNELIDVLETNFDTDKSCTAPDQELNIKTEMSSVDESNVVNRDDKKRSETVCKQEISAVNEDTDSENIISEDKNIKQNIERSESELIEIKGESESATDSGDSPESSLEATNSISESLDIFKSVNDNNKDLNTTIDKDISNRRVENISSLPEHSSSLSISGNNAEEPLRIRKLSNNLDILSDEEEDIPITEIDGLISDSTQKQCINIEDDDDIMLIDEEFSNMGNKNNASNTNTTDDVNKKKETEVHEQNCVDNENKKEDDDSSKLDSLSLVKSNSQGVIAEERVIDSSKLHTVLNHISTDEKVVECNKNEEKPLVSKDFLKKYKSNLADLTRDELEEFCILKIVESIVDRSSLSEIKSNLKVMAQTIEEYKKRVTMITKQNRDLQVVLKSVQEEQKKNPGSAITPLKITRSVGMQILMSDPIIRRKSNTTPNSGLSGTNINRPIRNPPNPSTRLQKTQANTNISQPIPVPRLVPATVNTGVKNPNVTSQVHTNNNNSIKQTSPIANGIRNPVLGSPKTAEKRTHNRIQSVTVDLTDDEPPPKLVTRNPPGGPVRLVSPQNLLAPQRPQFAQQINSPRKVYIPISGPQGQNVRPGQTLMVKGLPQQGPGSRVRGPVPAIRPSQNTVRLPRTQPSRHPAPLPDAMKQYQPPNWKALPPAPDLKLSKVENGIVISWKIEGYQEDSYEEIASYQLYAYQETSSTPNTALWKKIGDVKALPLPMACTLTQFMAGYKYYFAVRAVDIRSRLGPFSLPGSILLLSKT